MIDRPNSEEAIFHAALELAPEKRASYLASVCGGDDRLRGRIETLLQAGAEADPFFHHGPLRAAIGEGLQAGSSVILSIEEKPGTHIGRYKLLEKIGEGGMGVVYMAEQEEPVRRKVALKIIKLGMDTKQVVARFEAERQALALMDHPNIARVLDGGATETGRPYFVMELVPGVPITEFCDKNHLSTEARLNLFVPVCQAIQSAHQKGIIHRDLKPTNILVTPSPDGTGIPKVIDFGVAKATSQKLTEKTLFTQHGIMIGTPAYMSPEQAEMSHLDVDTRADIYSLGALLYELLTGSTPFPEQRLRSAGYNEMQRIILEEQPERPSTRLTRQLTANLPGASAKSKIKNQKSKIGDDLDWIVMKCLEKERARRYETANGLARDLERHLHNEPIMARPPSRLYEFQKTVRRHWVGFAAAVGILLTLAIGVVVSTLEAVRARRAEREQILLRAREAEQRQRADLFLYAGKMGKAQAAWELNRIADVRQWLQETAAYPDRGFEWYYWQRQTHLDLRTLRHLAQVWAVAFSPDGRRILTGGFDGTAKVWDAASGEERFTLRGHADAVTSVAFSSDGQRILTGSQDTKAMIWDAATGKELLLLNNHDGTVYGVAFSPDSRRVVTCSWDKTAKVWDAARGKVLLTFTNHAGPVVAVAFSSDGQQIATCSEDETAKIWEASSGNVLVTIPGHDRGYCWVAFSPDGRRLVTASYDGTASVWEIATRKELRTLRGHRQGVMVNTAQFSPDGQRILTSSDDFTAKVWEAATGRELFTIRGHGDKVDAAAFSPDGQRIITVSDDSTAKLWDAAASQGPLALKGHTAKLGNAAFSPDGRQIVTSGADRIARVWDAATGQVLRTLSGHTLEVRWAVFSPDGRRILTASGDKTARLWEADGNYLTLQGHRARLMCAAFSQDGQRIVTSSADGTAMVWDAASGNCLLTLVGHSNSVHGVAFSPDGRRIATASYDHTAKVWNSADGRELLTFTRHNCEVFSIAFSPDGQRLVTGGMDETVRVWESDSGNELLKLSGKSVAFSPDGQRIVTGRVDGTAKVCDATSGEELLALKGHDQQLYSVAFSPDGQRIVTASADGTANVWDTATASQVTAWQREEDQASERMELLRREQAAAAERARVLRAQDPGGVKQWLVLGPIRSTVEGLEALDQELIPQESMVQPRTGESIRAGESTNIWQAVPSDDYVLDLSDFNQIPGWRSVAYAVCYIESETNRSGLWMKVGSDDQYKVYLNGKEIYQQAHRRGHVFDQDVIGVEFRTGLNVLVFKLTRLHELQAGINWRASVHFTDAAGQPVKGIRVTLTPPPS
jgi:WD40 repeat protein/serine/threonine protein kinase